MSSFHFDPGRHKLTLDGFEIPSVTTILGRGLPKPALKFWAAKAVAEYAFDHQDAWTKLPRDGAVDLLKREPLRFTAAKANVGTAVHAAIAEYAQEGAAPEGLNDLEMGYYNAARSYLSEQAVEILESEATVYSRKYGYGGTFDLLQRRDGVMEIADFKTSKAVYPDVALQLVAYSRAEFIGAAEGIEKPLPEVRHGLIVRAS
jgi:hypothetical protein